MPIATAMTGGIEILSIAEAVAREKGIEQEDVIFALEQAIQVAGRKKYGHDQNIIARMDRANGHVKLTREREVVDVVPIDEETEEADNTKITLEDAQVVRKEIKMGEMLIEDLPPIDIGRVAAQTAKQVITQKVREAEREKQFEIFKDKKDTIVHGTVKNIEYGNVIIEVNGVEAVIRRDQLIPRENYRKGDRLRAYCYDVRREAKGPQVFLSRTSGDFMVKLFMQEVPEIYDGIIEIKAVARDPGSRAKIAVASNDSNIDPIASCVGIRGTRVQAVVSELQGEKIDIVPWSSDVATLVVNALKPAEVSKVVIDEDAGRIDVVAADDQQSIAIGRRGQNIRLTSKVAGWHIEIMTEDEESRRNKEEQARLSKLFTDSLNVEEIIAQLLVAEGFSTVEEVAYVEQDELASIEGFDGDIAEAVKQRAVEYLEEQLKDLENKLNKLEVAPDILELPGKEGEAIDPGLVLILAEKGIKNRDNIGDLSTDEFIELLPNSGLSEEEIENLIMTARSHWFDDENK